MSKQEKEIKEKTILKALSNIYDKSKTGIPYVSKPVDSVAEEYLRKYKRKDKAAKRMLNVQIAKCATSGFVTGFGGFITMPITIPADLSSVLYVQMRMIACTACIGGYDLNDDEVQTLVFACLAGVSVNNIMKQVGIKIGEKAAMQGVKKIPGKVLISINKKVGFRLLTKFGEKGIINIGKMIPIVGAVINGGFDMAETKLIAHQAYKLFIKNSFYVNEDNDEEIIEADSIESDNDCFESTNDNEN